MMLHHIISDLSIFCCPLGLVQDIMMIASFANIREGVAVTL